MSEPTIDAPPVTIYSLIRRLAAVCDTTEDAARDLRDALPMDREPLSRQASAACVSLDRIAAELFAVAQELDYLDDSPRPEPATPADILEAMMRPGGDR